MFFRHTFERIWCRLDGLNQRLEKLEAYRLTEEHQIMLRLIADLKESREMLARAVRANRLP